MTCWTPAGAITTNDRAPPLRSYGHRVSDPVSTARGSRPQRMVASRAAWPAIVSILDAMPGSR